MPAQSMVFCVLAVLFCLFNGFSTHAFAQIPGEMRFQKGQKFRFQVDHITEVTDSQGETKTTVKNTVLVTKLLEILSVDESTRSATITLKLEKLKMETVRPNGQILAFDSAAKNKDDGPLGKSLAPLIGKEIARLKVDNQGRVLEVRSEQTPAGRYEVEPVFLVVFPGKTLQVNETWQRAYNATLDPPSGTGEKVPMVQTYKIQAIDGPKATIQLETAWKTEPKTANDQMPLLQYLPQGTVVVETASGLPLEATLKIDREIKDSNGAGSSYKFTSTYVERRVE